MVCSTRYKCWEIRRQDYDQLLFRNSIYRKLLDRRTNEIARSFDRLRSSSLYHERYSRARRWLSCGADPGRVHSIWNGRRSNYSSSSQNEGVRHRQTSSQPSPAARHCRTNRTALREPTSDSERWHLGKRDKELCLKDFSF